VEHVASKLILQASAIDRSLLYCFTHTLITRVRTSAGRFLTAAVTLAEWDKERRRKRSRDCSSREVHGLRGDGAMVIARM
jgi:hypothetical protein